MKLRSLLISSFRGIDSLELRFEAAEGKSPQPLVALADPNACGKTSILEAILICLGRADLIPRQTDPKFDVMTTSSGFFLEAEMTGGRDIIIRAESRLDGTVTHSVRRPAETSEHARADSSKRPPALPVFPAAYFSSWRAPKLVGPVPITAGKRGRRPSKTEENRLWRLKSYFVNLKAREAFVEAPSQSQQNRAGHGLLERLNQA